MSVFNALKNVSSAKDLPENRLHDKWGNWEFDSERLTLWNPVCGYEIDLKEIWTCGQILDWLCQIAAKVPEEDYQLRNLHCALEHILKIQANYCSGGKEKRCDGGKLARAHAAGLRRQQADLKRQKDSKEGQQ